MSNDIKEKLVPAHQSGKDYKAISETVQVHHSTVRQIIHKWKAAANLHRNGGHEVHRENAQKTKTSY